MENWINLVITDGTFVFPIRVNCSLHRSCYTTDNIHWPHEDIIQETQHISAIYHEIIVLVDTLIRLIPIHIP